MDGICVMSVREYADTSRGLYLAMKGGSNAESHNHNDVGSFVVYSDGKPVLIDVGVGAYTAKTFSAERYTIWTMRSNYHNIPEINGTEQIAGEKYCAKNILYNENDGSLSLELKDAYPSGSGIKSYRRTGQLAQNTVRITDSFEFAENGDIRQHLMCCEKPIIQNCGTISVSDCLIKYDISLNAEIEEIILADENISGAWKRDRLYRITLTSGQIRSMEYTLGISQIKK